VGRTLSQSFSSSHADQAFASQLLNAIDTVHGVQGITGLRIERGALPEGWNGQFDPYTRTVTVSTSAQAALSTGAHEVGHALDAVFLVSASNMGRIEGPVTLYASQYAASDRGVLVNWLQSVLATSAVQDLRQLRASFAFMSDEWHELAYLIDVRELWARSYEQFIGSNAKDDDLKAQFLQASQRESQVGGRKIRVYWTQEDFRPVEREMKRLLESLGWM
jgi:hypothetical protein